MPFVAAKITPLGDVSLLAISYAAFAALRTTGRQVMSAQISLEPVDATYVTILVDTQGAQASRDGWAYPA
jgi:hypothetical protein